MSQPVALLESGSYAAARATQIWVACVTIQGHGVVHAQATAKGHVWICGPIAARVCVNVCSSYCY